MKVRQVLISSIITLILAGGAHAQFTVFQGGVSWNTGTWSDGIPTAHSNAVIGQSGALVLFDALASPALISLTINATATAPRFLHSANPLTASTVTVGDSALGSYEQSGGLLTAATLIVGNTGSGVYAQTGGSLVVTGNSPLSHLIIGAGNGGVGRFELSNDASVTANAIHVGGGLTGTGAVSSGTFVQNSGAVAVTGGAGEVVVGDSPGTSGLYEMKGGTLAAKQLYVGVRGANPTAGERAFYQTGGSVTISDNLILGGFSGGDSTAAGSFNLAGNEATSVLTTSKVWVGLSGSGTFTQDGGTHNITIGNVEGDRSLLIAAAQPGSEGVYNMKSGVLNTQGIYVGSFDPSDGATGGKGTLNQSGGTINVAQQLIVDNGGAAGTLGKYVMTGGALNTTGSDTFSGLLVVGTFQQDGGIVTANGSDIDAGMRIDGTYTLAGGTLQGNGAKINYGTFSGFGIIGGSGKVTNEGLMTFTGGNSTISAPVENGSGRTLEVKGGEAAFDGAFRNRGDFETWEADVEFTEFFSNSGGRYYSDASNQDFGGGFENVPGVNDSLGYILTDSLEPGDLFRMGGDFLVQSANLTLWDTTTAILEFYKGTGNSEGSHSLIYAGLDYEDLTNGKGFLGFQKNLSWGEVIIGTGNSLQTAHGEGRALYTQKLTLGSNDLAGIASQVASFSGDLKIYYDPADNPHLQGRKILFGSGTGYIAPVPEPSAMLLAGIGAMSLSIRRRRRL